MMQRILFFFFFVAACMSFPFTIEGLADQRPKKGGTVLLDTIDQRNALVDFSENPKAPKPPGIGIAISLDQDGSPAQFQIGKPAVLHGAYSADMDLSRLCREGVAESIMISIIRVDKPWGETIRLFTPKAIVKRPQIPANTPYDESYRIKGQFKVDLAKFFNLPDEPGRYKVDATIGPYHSERLDLEIR